LKIYIQQIIFGITDILINKEIEKQVIEIPSVNIDGGISYLLLGKLMDRILNIMYYNIGWIRW